MIIIGIDPGTSCTGYGIISVKDRVFETLDYGCIRPPKTVTLHEKYLIIFDGICHLIEKFKPEALSIETQFVNKNPQSALKIGMARGVAILACTKNKMHINEYTPRKAKLSVVGNGSASKSQVQAMIKMLLKLSKEPPSDAADALALAICHLHTLGH